MSNVKSKVAVFLVLVAVAVIVTRLLGVWGKPAAEPGTARPAVRDGSAAVVAAPPPAPSSGGPAMQRAPELAHDDDPTGTIRLEGQVIDDKDAPVAGAHVAIDANPPKQVDTDASGNFAFEGLIARDYRLEATSERGYAGPARLRLAPSPEPVTLRLHPGGTVDVVVTEAGATPSPIAGAEVELRATLIYRAKTDAKGIAHLANVGAGFSPLAVHAAGFAPNAMMLESSGDPAAPVRVGVALAKGAAIAGRVVDDAGKPVGGALVVATSASEPFPVVDARRDGVQTGPDGTFHIPAVAAGTWRLTATRSTFGPATSAPITVDGTHDKTGVELALAVGGIVRGHVVDKAGKPVASADVRVVVHGNLEWRAQRQAFTGADGAFAIEGLPRRAVDIVAAHAGGASAIAPADLVAKREVELTLTLDITGMIEGAVVDGAGQGVGDAQVIAEPVFDGGLADRQAWSVRGVQETVSDQGGVFRFTGLPDGTYRVRAARPGATEAALDLAKSVEARPGGPKLRLVVSADGKITGKVAFKDGKVPAAFTVALGSTYPTPFATADGTFSIPAPTGKQTIVVDGKAFLASKAQDVTVVEGKPADVGTITVEPGRSVSGLVLDESGTPVAGAKVAAGILLTGDGKELYIPDESIMAKDAVSDADGRYHLEGFSPAAITIVAGKDPQGRSASVQLPPGSDSAKLDLVLRPTTGLDGKVTRDGQPSADTIVIANPIGAHASNFFTATGADGTFALDALAPGGYIVHAMVGGGGGRPKDLYLIQTSVALGARTHVAIDTTPGPATLTATFKSDAGAPVMGMVLLIEATVVAKMSNELRDLDQLNVFGDKVKVVSMRIAMGAPVEIVGVRPDDYTLCIMPLAGRPDPSAPPSPVKCQPVKIGAAPKQAVDVVVPASIIPKP